MTRGLSGQSPANNGAANDVLDVIRQMPDQEYGSMADVTKGIGDVE